ncbi:MAG: hypothetical protein KME17_08250 [Cyanosarcina radialis HA8281-LM2]|jgi:hypothetical protein|nr:hypothetical protein [Cyanosarcina radialis HA8281-LM2]
MNATGTITGLQVVTNLYRSTVNFTNTEYSGNDRTIPSQNSEAVGNAWIPWCDRADDFAGHHMEIQSEDKSLTYYIWQHLDTDGDFVRYSTDGFETPGKPIPGNAGTGQSVLLTILANGSLLMTHYDGPPTGADREPELTSAAA